MAVATARGALARMVVVRGVERVRFLRLQSFILSVYVLFSFFHTAVTTSVARFEQPRVETLSLGEPFETLRMIREENITTVGRLDALASDTSLEPLERAVYRHAPILLEQPERALRLDDTILGLYYTVSESTSETATASTIRYFLWLSDENGGTPIRQRMALYGHPLDRELVYRVTFLNDAIVAAYYQAPGHRQARFPYDGETRPAFQIASANNNFGRVLPTDVERAGPNGVLALLPQRESGRNFRNPDYLALAAREALLQYDVDMSEYVYVAFYNPAYSGSVTISVRFDGRWHYLHDDLGRGITAIGYRRVAVHVGARPFPADIEEVRIITRTVDPVPIEVSSVYIYPPVAIES